MLRVRDIYGHDLGIYPVKTDEEKYDLVYNRFELDYDSVIGYVVPEFALFEGRHGALDGIPAIFGKSIEDPTDLRSLEERAEQFVCYRKEFAVYVTGLTVATVAVINACHKLGVRLTLWHWDRDSGSYYPQEVY